jgi:hypothetical protein
MQLFCSEDHALKSDLEGKNYYAVEGKVDIGSLNNLPYKIEGEIKSHVSKFEEYKFGLAPTGLCSLAYQIALTNNIPTRFNIRE